MAYISDNAFDAALTYITGAATTIHVLTSAFNDTFASVGTNTLGNKASAGLLSAPADGAGGREVTVSAITDGNVTADGTANKWAIVSGSELLASGTLSADQVLSNGNTLTLSSFAFGINDAV